MTPMGLYHRACAPEIPNRARIDTGGKVTREDGTTYQVPRCPYAAIQGGLRDAQQPNLFGKLEFAWDSLSSLSSYTQIEAIWQVPPKPPYGYNTNQAFYAFPALDNGTYILQPVLAYGYWYPNSDSTVSNSWYVAAWHCSAGPCPHSPPLGVTVGDFIFGSVTRQSCQGSTCDWTVYAANWTTGGWVESTFQDANSHYNFAYGGAMEVKNLTACGYFPPNGVFLTNVYAMEPSGPKMGPWNVQKPDPAHTSPWCGFNVLATNRWNVGQPALTAAQSHTSTAGMSTATPSAGTAAPCA